MKKIKVGDKYIGNGHPCFIVAEIGINHGGNIKLAFRMIDAAKKSGADAVKFQNYRTEDFIRDRNIKYNYISKGKKITETQYAMFKRCEISFQDLKKIKAYCDRKKIIFFSTPTSIETLMELKRVRSPIIKNGSDFLTNLELISAMAKSKKPTVISCGMASIEEINEAIKSYKMGGGKKLILLHCTSSYPTPIKDINLNRISEMKKLFNYIIGYSDHSEGYLAAVGAVTLGACFIEKHFTLSKKLNGPDHRFSSDPKEFSELVKAVRNAEAAMGKYEINPVESELYGKKFFRLSCIALKNLNKGHKIKKEDIGFSRPGDGLPPKEKPNLIGKVIKRNIKKNNMILNKDIV